MDTLITSDSCLSNFIINYFLTELMNNVKLTNPEKYRRVALLSTNDLTSYQNAKNKQIVVTNIRNTRNFSQGKTAAHIRSSAEKRRNLSACSERH